MTRQSINRLLAVGDIHGHLEKLEALMESVRPNSGDRVIFLGDYIDRGPDSRGVIEFLMGFEKRFPGAEAFFLRGNHEQLFLDALAGFRDMGPSFEKLRDISTKAVNALDPDDWGLYLANGGEITFKSYSACNDYELACYDIPDMHIEFLKGTRFFHEEAIEIATDEGIEIRSFLFVHAGISPDVKIGDQDPLDFLWMREPFLSSNSSFGGMIVVHGHTPCLKVTEKPVRRICLDSGVYLTKPADSDEGQNWGKLTCCNVLTREIWQSG